MRKIVAIVLTAAVFVGAGLAAPQKERTAEARSDIEKLSAQRIELLQERVDYIELLIRHQITGSTALIQPTLDLLSAKLEYAKSNEERRAIYDEMLKQYDRLIELAELEEERSGTREMLIGTHRDSAYLTSEKLRITIERESVE